jgi:beta-glucosidase
MHPDETRLRSLVDSLDLETKVQLLTGASTFTLHGCPEIGLAAMNLSDGPTGVRGLRFAGGQDACLLPNATLLASAWSEETTREAGQILSEEAERQDIHVVLGPTINLHRTPLGGRLFEAYSEDPLLTGRLATSYVDALQENGIGACLKHLVANESETERHTVDSRVDEATLREVYLLPFEIAVQESDPWSVMAAYNRVNGLTATEQVHVNTEILKGEWAYTGLLMSDWHATTSTAASANGGLDLVMPGPDGPWGDQLVKAVRNGEVSEATVDDHVARLLRLADRVGALGDTRRTRADLPEPASPARRVQLERLAASGMTVLTNDGTLPLAPDTKVALIGRHAVDTVDMGGGSAVVRPPHQITVAEGFADRFSRVEVVDGVEVRTRARPGRPGYLVDPDTGLPGIRVLLVAADGTVIRDERLDETTTLAAHDHDLAGTPVRAELTATVVDDGRVEVGVLGAGSWVLDAGGEEHRCDIRLETSDLGEAVLRPPGWTTETDSDGRLLLKARVDLYDGQLGRIGLVARPAHRRSEQVIADGVRAAEQAEVAVVVVGLTEEEETEALDKSTLALPGDQDAMVAAVAAAARRTVVVVNAATPVLMPWLSEVDAVLWAGLPGQEGGHAVAAALRGDFEPAGRLVTTFPAEDGASVAWTVRPTDGALDYSEGAYLGYRGHFADRAPAPLFWFGHGLGYGSWEYGDVAAEPGPDAPVVRVPVTNTSSTDSREVVQVYFRPTEPDQPVRLVGWDAVDVPAGQTVTATVSCEPRMWRRWDTATGGWQRLAPGGELLVARGLGDVRGQVPVPSV